MSNATTTPSSATPAADAAKTFVAFFTATIDPDSAHLSDLPGGNVRHELNPCAVQGSVDKRIAEFELRRSQLKQDALKTLESYAKAVSEGTIHLWGKPPGGPAYVDPMIDEWIARERDYYAKVRVIELANPNKGCVLVYGDVDDTTVDSGTGPFESLDRANDWFMNGGR